MGELLLAVDQGTSSTKAMLVDRAGGVVAETSAAVGQTHPKPGWVEQDAEEIWTSVVSAVRACVPTELARDVAGVALSVQRESTVVWDRATARPLSPILGWQDQRTATRAAELERAGHASYVFDTTGLPLDPMFSALKASWLLDDLDPDRSHTAAGRWCVGTLESWLLARMCGVCVTEAGSASRTQLLDLGTGTWDPKLLEIFEVPAAAVPEVVPSTLGLPITTSLPPLPSGLPVLAVMADSHAALFAHAGWRPGVVKATYGTGSSVMSVGTGSHTSGGLCSTIAWDVGGPIFAREANIRSTGRTLTWLADLLGADVGELWEEAAAADSAGVVLVPAFGGLGAPHWDRDAVSLVTGLGLDSRRPALARAALESIAFQIDDVLRAFSETLGSLDRLMCDGGMTRSSALMQFQADLSDVAVCVAPTANLSALGVGHLAGVVVGWWSLPDLEQRRDEAHASAITPAMPAGERERRRGAWSEALRRAGGRP